MKKSTLFNFLIVLCFSVFAFSCKKNAQKDFSPDEVVNKALEEQFFTVLESTPPSVKQIAEKLKKDNRKRFFIDRVAKKSGYPIWEKALIIGDNSASQTANRTKSESDTLLIFVPLSPTGTTEINGVFAGKVVGDSVLKINLINESDYAKLGFNDSALLNADDLISLLMYFQNSLFGTESFIVNDTRLFKGIKPTIKEKNKKLIRFKTINSESPAGTSKSRLIEIEYCYKISGKISNHIASSVGFRCDIFSYWISDNTLPSYDNGDEDSGGGTGGGGDSGGGSGNGGGNETVISTQTILQEILNLDPGQVAFLNTYSQLAEEIYNYINHGDGYLNFDECKAKAVGHIDYCMEYSVYLNFCLQKSRYFLLLNGWSIPWFHEASAGVSSPELYSNIQQLKLDVKQAFYLSGNPNLNVKVAAYLSNSNGQTSEEQKSAVTEHINGLLTNPAYALFVQNYETSDNTGKMWWENDIWLSNPNNFNFDITNEDNPFKGLTAAEKILVATFPLQAFIIKQNVTAAFSVTNMYMGTAGGLNDKKDAFRHAFFQAINTQEVPGRAIPIPFSGSAIVRLFADAHESEVPIELSLEKEMDLYNNIVGINYCQSCWSNSFYAIADAILIKLNNGELKYLKNLDFTTSPNWPAGLNGITVATEIKWTNQ